MHVVRLLAPPLEGEDHSKDIDFSPSGIRRRWDTGYADTQRVLAQAPWTGDFDPLEGFILHEAAGGVMTHETPEVGEPVDAAAEREEEIGHAADEGLAVVGRDLRGSPPHASWSGKLARAPPITLSGVVDSFSREARWRWRGTRRGPRQHPWILGWPGPKGRGGRCRLISRLERAWDQQGGGARYPAEMEKLSGR